MLTRTRVLDRHAEQVETPLSDLSTRPTVRLGKDSHSPTLRRMACGPSPLIRRIRRRLSLRGGMDVACCLDIMGRESTK